MTKDLTDGIDKGDNLKIIAESFIEDSNKVDASLPSCFDWVVSRMHGLNYAIFEAEKSGVSKEQIHEIIKDVRAFQAKSLFVARLQKWDRGYQGDFETIEYLLSGENKTEPNTVEFWIEKYCLNTAIAEQHRNKVQYQADRIFRTILKGVNKGEPAKILIIACGTSPDVQAMLDLIEPYQFQIVLNDMDESALDHSVKKLSSIQDRIQIVSGNTFRLLRKFKKFGKFDLVLAGGLFDYLDEDQSIFLSKMINAHLLVKGGKFIFTNIAAGNPYRYWMEYCANWFLIERSEKELHHILESAGFVSENILIRKESTELTFLIEAEN